MQVKHDAGVMLFFAEGSQTRVSIAWPAGWSARIVAGRAELVTPENRVFARDGDVIQNRVVGGVGDDGTFLVCSITQLRDPPTIPSEKPPEPI